VKVANRSGSDPRNLISGVSWWNPRNPWCNDHWGGSAGKSIKLFTSFHKKSIEISKSLQFLQHCYLSSYHRRNLRDSKGNPLFFVSSQTKVSPQELVTVHGLLRSPLRLTAEGKRTPALLSSALGLGVRGMDLGK